MLHAAETCLEHHSTPAGDDLANAFVEPRFSNNELCARLRYSLVFFVDVSFFIMFYRCCI